MPEAGRATLATVAAAAGVSVATVSKVVNGRSDVAPSTRALVQALLQQHEYTGRAGAAGSRATAAVGGPTVEVTFAENLNAYSNALLHGILEAGAEQGVTVAVSVHQRTGSGPGTGGPSGWASAVTAAGRRAVVAVVDDLSHEDLELLTAAGVPLVMIDPYNLPSTRVPSVGATNFAGGVVATRHLLSLGHRRIGYVGGPSSAACNQARLHGYRAALEAEGITVPESYVRTGKFLYEDGVVEGALLLELEEPPTAVFAASDETAAGVLEAARRHGLRVPGDLSVLGFDDTDVARFASPPLTTVRQPLREIGGVALRAALRLAAGEELESHHVELATELVVRQSTGVLPSTGAPAPDPGGPA